jgi:hypothetical protein
MRAVQVPIPNAPFESIDSEDTLAFSAFCGYSFHE